MQPYWIPLGALVVSCAAVIMTALVTRGKMWGDRTALLSQRITELEREGVRKDERIKQLESDCRMLREEQLVLMRRLLLGEDAAHDRTDSQIRRT